MNKIGSIKKVHNKLIPRGSRDHDEISHLSPNPVKPRTYHAAECSPSTPIKKKDFSSRFSLTSLFDFDLSHRPHNSAAREERRRTLFIRCRKDKAVEG
jgi:hypothetical protein